MADEQVQTEEQQPQNGDGGAQNSRAQERIQELVASRKAEENARKEAELRAKQAYDQTERLQRLLEERLESNKEPEEEEWVDPGEKALKENAKLRQELDTFRQSQSEKEQMQRVNYEIQQAVAQFKWEDMSRVTETMAREYFAHKGMGINDSFDAADVAKRLNEEEKSRKTAWLESKKQQAEATSSAVAGSNSRPVVEPHTPTPAWGTPERKEWEKATASEIIAKFRT